MAGAAGATVDGLGETAPGVSVNMGLVAAIVAVATIGGFMFGYDSGVINGTQEGLERAFHLSKLGTGLNVGAILLGCAAGAFAAGRLADVWGRRSVMMAAAVAFVISALAAGAADTSTVFILARILGGLGVGAASVLCPVYISEVTPAAMRGRLASVQQIMIIIGLTAAFVVNYVLARTAGGSTAVIAGHPAWRWMFWVQTGPAVIFLVSLFSIPESPRFLVSKGSDAHAGRILTRLFDAEEARRKVAEIRGSLVRDHRPQMRDLLDPISRKVRPIVWAGVGIAIFQQLVGINVVFYYGAVLWRQVGFSENDALQINILSGALSVLACLAAIAVIDRIGRKPMLLIGSAGMTVSLALVALAFATGHQVNGQLTLSHGMGLLALIAANGFTVFFNFSWGPVMWVMLGEMFPNQLRGSALAVCGFAQWFANYLITQSFPIMLTGIGLAASYSFYGACAVISFFLVQRFIVETKGRELEDMVG